MQVRSKMNGRAPNRRQLAGSGATVMELVRITWRAGNPGRSSGVERPGRGSHSSQPPSKDQRLRAGKSEQAFSFWVLLMCRIHVRRHVVRRTIRREVDLQRFTLKLTGVREIVLQPEYGAYSARLMTMKFQ